MAHLASPPKPREYAPIVSPRPSEMKVLVLGMSRTGTMSMYVALQKLGYQSYHMLEAALNHKNNNHLTYWLEAVKAKYYGQGRPYQGTDFDKMLWNYDAVTDTPCVHFVDELVSTYPNAKVVLTNRDVEKWLASMDRSFYTLLSWKSWDLLARLDKDFSAVYWPLLNLLMKVWTKDDLQNRDNLRQSYFEHYKHVREIVPKENLLDFTPQDGWGPLCAFLGKPVPKEPYPHVNVGNDVIKLHMMLYWGRWITVATRFVKVVAAVAVPLGAIWYYTTR